MKVVRNYLIPHQENNFKPLLFTEASLLTIGLLAFLLFISSATTSYLVRNSSSLAAVYASVLVDMTNSDRMNLNLPLLTKNPLLEQAAQLKANDMASKSYFAHTSPEGITPWHWLTVTGYNFLYAGENLAEGFNESADVNNGWISSSPHKENIISPHFTEIGIATAKGLYNGVQTTFVVQYFGQPQAIVVPKTPSASTKTKIPAILPLPTTQVLGESIENDLEVPVKILNEDQNFIGVENIQAALAYEPAPLEVVVPSYSSWYDRLLIQEPSIIEIIFSIISLVILISLLLFVTIEFHTHHRRYAFLGLGLMSFLIVLIVINHSMLLVPASIF